MRMSVFGFRLFIFTSVKYDSLYFLRKLIVMYSSAEADSTEIGPPYLLIIRNIHQPKTKSRNARKNHDDNHDLAVSFI